MILTHNARAVYHIILNITGVITIRTIADAVGCAKVTTYRLVHELMAAGLVARAGKEQHSWMHEIVDKSAHVEFDTYDQYNPERYKKASATMSGIVFEKHKSRVGNIETTEHGFKHYCSETKPKPSSQAQRTQIKSYGFSSGEMVA